MNLNKLKEMVDSSIKSAGGDIEVVFFSEDGNYRDFVSIGMSSNMIVFSNLNSGPLFERLFIQREKPIVDKESLE